MEETLDPVVAQAGVDVEDGGRLLVARRASHSAALVAVPPQNARNFSSLLVRPQVASTGHSVAEIHRLIQLAQLWEGARVGGSGLARARQQACVQAIVSAAIGVLGGRTWETVELRVRNGDDLDSTLRAAALAVAPAKADEGTKGMLVRRLAPLASCSDESLEDAFLSVVRWLTKDEAAVSGSRFALMLAGSPRLACDWAEGSQLSQAEGGDAVTHYLAWLCTSQFIPRAARYVTLLRWSKASGPKHECS
jgi:hypothetical protein